NFTRVRSGDRCLFLFSSDASESASSNSPSSLAPASRFQFSSDGITSGCSAGCWLRIAGGSSFQSLCDEAATCSSTDGGSVTSSTMNLWPQFIQEIILPFVWLEMVSWAAQEGQAVVINMTNLLVLRSSDRPRSDRRTEQ